MKESEKRELEFYRAGNSIVMSIIGVMVLVAWVAEFLTENLGEFGFFCVMLISIALGSAIGWWLYKREKK